MKTLWKTLTYPFRMIWNFFDHDSGKIVSKRGHEILYEMDKQKQKELLSQLMKHDEEAGLYEEDAKAYRKQYEYEEELMKERSIEFAKWLAKDWMSIWVVDKWMWEWQNERTSETFKKYKEYYTEEELYELYLEETQ